jgi:hypothetical protein
MTPVYINVNLLSSQPFATPEKIHDIVTETYKNIKSQLASVHRSMALYLANRDTEVILFKPVKVSLQIVQQIILYQSLSH